jgi:hypothetical protein
MVKHTVYDYDHYWQADAFFLPVEKYLICHWLQPLKTFNMG